MNKNKLREQDLNSARISDLSIQSLPSGKDTLILVCQNESNAENLHRILSNHPYDLQVSIEDKTRNYILEFQFIDSGLAMIYKTEKNEKTYPPIGKLKNQEITHITTGVWEKNTGNGRNCLFLEPIGLGELNVSNILAKASGVQFVTSDSPEQPSAVILTFDSFDHILSAEADKAYNKLIDMTKGKPSLEINAKGDTVTLLIWDILIDLDTRIENLHYNKEELEGFLLAVDPKKSLTFALGFIPPVGKKAAMAATKPGDIELITFFGYVLKDER